jgi:hypothetical protein
MNKSACAPKTNLQNQTRKPILVFFSSNRNQQAKSIPSSATRNFRIPQASISIPLFAISNFKKFVMQIHSIVCHMQFQTSSKFIPSSATGIFKIPITLFVTIHTLRRKNRVKVISVATKHPVQLKFPSFRK